MSLLKLFINDGDEKTDVKVVESPNKFPDATKTTSNPITFPVTGGQPSTTVNIPQQQLSCEPYLETVVNMYEKGFEGLNQEGYDFYEFYKSIIQFDVNNPATYTMAFGMAQAINKGITKDFLIQKSEYYVTEITKVYNDYVSAGNGKKQQLLATKSNETTQLSNDLQQLRQQLASLQTLIETKQNELNLIDSKYQPQLNEIDCKLMANDVAKNKILGSITTVKQGLLTNIK